MSGYKPPRFLERILEWALPGGLSGQGTLGDLAEGFESRAIMSPLRAWLWYAIQTVSIVTYRVFTGSGAETGATNSDLVMDVRWSFRTFMKRPGFSLGVVTVLGLGLGAIAAVYSVVDGTIKNTSWWSEPDRTVAIWPDNQFSFGMLDLYSQEQSTYDAVGGYVEAAYAVRTRDGESQSVNGVMITPEIFQELSVQPVLGRALDSEDAYFGVESVVVMSEDLWRRSFGADPEVVGSRIDISGGLVTVVGIQGAGGRAPGGRAELWFPAVMDPRDDDFFKAQTFTAVGVLRTDQTLDDAHNSLMTFTDRQSDLFPTFYPQGYAVGWASVQLADAAQRRMISTPLMLLMSGTALLMLVTALNVGNLLLGRSIDRRKELSVRSSLGASRWRVVRQLLVEGFVLTTVALGIGLLVASWGGQFVAGLFVEEAVVGSSSILSPSVLMFVLGVAGLAWVVLNGVPILHFLRSHRDGLQLKPDSAATVQRGLVSVQAGLATLLLVSASLLVVTVGNLRDVPLGFDPEGIITLALSPPEDRTSEIPDARDLYQRLAAGVQALPDVQAAGLTGWLPLRNQAPTTPINLQSNPVDPREAVKAPMHMVDRGFFEVFGIEPIAGRLLGIQEESTEAPSAVVVNQSLADLLWPDGSALGQMIAIDPHEWETWAPVVGVIPDIRSGDITGTTGPALYVALAESPARDITLVVRSNGSTASLIPALGRTVREVDMLVPIRTISRMTDVVRAAYATSWVLMGLLLVLAVLATGLGAIGIYGVLAHHVSLNKREIGVRMALGAQPEVVVGGVVRSGLTLAGIGILIGSVAAAVSTRFLESLLFEVSSLAPWAFVGPAIALAAAAGLAAWIPAARAGRLPPAEVLRSD